ncbi:hypothetical protein DSM106972_081260 [Dulcicalothrix desertica PCC 7102]|uniref:Uncharacterized protein n=1 Tax=Dulcicalothrix desertica PCC 7102 TaxID=232991 RepID=A0A3S1CUJ2_9CYAN|nr:hypothetical protein DSM106972_081260 [Dulcicalothrix desertica PCC 7102]TWH54900.1 hypothetical protein CAL7102_02986 [Dulcicalothrix desertica PCC 7102]
MYYNHEYNLIKLAASNVTLRIAKKAVSRVFKEVDMHSDNFRVVMISIFAAINFLIGIVIGIKLYSVTSESSSDQSVVTHILHQV